MKDREEDFADLLGRFLVRAGLDQQDLARKVGIHRNTIGHWLNRTSRPQLRGQVLQIADELSLLKQERKAFTHAAGFSLERWPTEVWTVPQQRDMFFTGRDNVLQSLRELLVPGSMAALTQAVSGLGGIGKTHTAVEFAYRFHKYYEAVLWLQADSWEILVSACMELADELGLPEQKEKDHVVAEVQNWLRKHRYWLLVLDNVENPQEILTKFVPTDHQGSVLMTTRIHDVEPLAQTQELSTMSEQEGILFLLRRTKKIAAKAGSEQASSVHYDEAHKIWQLMAGLPLALDQAGAYILETGCSFSTYQEQYTHRCTELLHRRGKRFIGHEASVATTFSLAFEQVEAFNPAAADILRMCSLLHGEAIPEELFQKGAEYLGPHLAIGINSWDLVLGVLQDYSLVQRNTETKTLTMHRLVQSVIKDLMQASIFQMWTKRTIQAVEAIFPDEDEEYTSWSQCERYLAQALTCAALIENDKATLPEAAALLNRTASYLQDRARYEQAELLYQQALTIRQQQLGLEHLDTAEILNNLASLYNHQGKYGQAESLYQQALAVYQQQLGLEHPDTATILNNLALLYNHQGKYGQAESLYQQALAVYQQQLGSQHLHTAVVLDNLASVYRAQGKYEQAELFYQQALTIRQQQLGSEHPDVAGSLNNLASLYRDQSKYDQAEPLFQKALAIRKRQLGLEHPDTALILNNLGLLYRVQGRYDQAEPFYQQALTTYQQIFGPEHPYTASALNNLARLYQAQDKYNEAESLFQQALHISERVVGMDHPTTLKIRKSHEGLLFARKNRSENLRNTEDDINT